MIRQAYLEAAALATGLLGDAAVAAAWDRPSALEKMDVGALAGHLARQITSVPAVLGESRADDAPIDLLDHYLRSRWVAADLDSDANTSIRENARQESGEGAAALVQRTAATLSTLGGALAAEPADRVVYLPWAGWSLTLDDFLVTRMLELAIHSDDLAVSVGVDTPVMPEEVAGRVLGLLCRLSVHRHGMPAVLRALSRAERAPASIAAI